MMIPWGLFTTNPELVVLVPFVWFLWQFYAPPLIDKLVGYDSDSQDHLYETRVTQKLQNIFAQIERVDDNVERVAETQEDLVNITLAQTHQMNGYDGEIDVEEVEKRLVDEEDDAPRDFLRKEDPSDEERWKDNTDRSDED